MATWSVIVTHQFVSWIGFLARRQPARSFGFDDGARESRAQSKKRNHTTNCLVTFAACSVSVRRVVKQTCLTLALVMAAGCGSDPGSQRSHTGGSASTATGAGGAAPGSMAVGGSGQLGGALGSGGSSRALGGRPSGSAESGGAPSAASGGALPSGGMPAAGGANATGGSNTTSAGGSVASGDLAIAAGLNTRIDVPCAAHDAASELCGSVMTLPAKMITLGGDSARTYKITLHVRGLTEAHTFTPVDGGAPIIANPAAPYLVDSTQATPNQDAHAAFWVDVASPQKNYYFNAFSSDTIDFDHYLFALDYSAEIVAKGGTTIQFHFADSNDEQSANFMHVVVPNVPPAPGMFDGQFVQLDVISVAQ